MLYALRCLLALALFFGCTQNALAHRVNIFAYVDGEAIQVECSFSKSNKVRNGKLVITDQETSAPILEAITDEEGMFRFRPADAFLGSGHGLSILLLAGEGHRAIWHISAQELRELAHFPAQPPVAEDSDKKEITIISQPAVPQSLAPLAEHPIAANDAPYASNAELEALIGKVLDEKLGPIRQSLARQQESEPDIRDIIGGLGWIIGLLGLATYMKYRRNTPN